MPSDHPWAILPELVACEILTKDEAKDVVLGTTMYQRIMGELQAMMAEAQSRGEDTVTIKKVYGIVAKVQMQESPNY